MDNLIAHIAQAYAHYDDVFDHQFNYIVHFSPVWSKKNLWEKYYYPICDELEELWDTKMDEFLITLR